MMRVPRASWRRFGTATVLATVLLGGGLPTLIGTAHAATITPTPDTAANDASHSFTVNDATAPLLVTGATLTKADDASVTLSGATASTPSKVTATFDLYRALPGAYNLTLTGPVANSCTSCVTITGLPAALDLTTPAKVFPGDTDPALGSTHLTNPLRGGKYTGRIRLTMYGVPNLTSAQFRVYDATNSASPEQIPLTVVNGDLVGYLGPQAGFTVGQGYDVTTPLQFWLAPGAPYGTLHIDADFGEVATDGTLKNVQAADSANVALSAVERGAVFHATAPTRLVDTRASGQGGALAAHESRTFTLAAAPLTDATALTENITTMSASQFGSITVYPAGANPSKGEGNIAYRPARAIANLVTAPVSADHKVVIRNNGTASVHVTVDLVGYYTAKRTPIGSTYTSVAPSRLLDTRKAPNKVLQPGQTVVIDKLSTAGVPTNADAIAVTVFVLTPTRAGTVTAYAKGASRPVSATTVSFLASRPTSNFAVVKLGGTPAGITLRNDTTGTLHLAVDLAGYFAPVTTGSVFHATPITRAIDSRDGTGTSATPLAGRTGRTIVMAGKGGIPSSGATFVALNITAVNPAGNGYLVAFSGDTAMPGTATMYYASGENGACVAYLRLPSTGTITFSNTGTASVGLVVDVLGWGGAE